MAGLGTAGWAVLCLWQVISLIHCVTAYECKDVAHSQCSGPIRSFVVMLVCKSQVKIDDTFPCVVFIHSFCRNKLK